jgi:hypothetical protein
MFDGVMAILALDHLNIPSLANMMPTPIKAGHINPVQHLQGHPITVSPCNLDISLGMARTSRQRQESPAPPHTLHSSVPQSPP